jgi:hypothetical protein
VDLEAGNALGDMLVSLAWEKSRSSSSSISKKMALSLDNRSHSFSYTIDELGISFNLRITF